MSIPHPLEIAVKGRNGRAASREAAQARRQLRAACATDGDFRPRVAVFFGFAAPFALAAPVAVDCFGAEDFLVLAVSAGCLADGVVAAALFVAVLLDAADFVALFAPDDFDAGSLVSVALAVVALVVGALVVGAFEAALLGADFDDAVAALDFAGDFAVPVDFEVVFGAGAFFATVAGLAGDALDAGFAAAVDDFAVDFFGAAGFAAADLVTAGFGAAAFFDAAFGAAVLGAADLAAAGFSALVFAAAAGFAGWDFEGADVFAVVFVAAGFTAAVLVDLVFVAVVLVAAGLDAADLAGGFFVPVDVFGADFAEVALTAAGLTGDFAVTDLVAAGFGAALDCLAAGDFAGWRFDAAGLCLVAKTFGFAAGAFGFATAAVGIAALFAAAFAGAGLFDAAGLAVAGLEGVAFLVVAIVFALLVGLLRACPADDAALESADD